MLPITTDRAPGAIGPYSQAIVHGDLVFCSGQIPLDAVTGEIVGTDVGAQTGKVLQNLQAVLHAAGSSLDRIVKTTVFLTTMDDFAAMNEAYTAAFASLGPHKPARSTVAVVGLPRGVRVEIEAIAVVQSNR